MAVRFEFGRLRSFLPVAIIVLGNDLASRYEFIQMAAVDEHAFEVAMEGFAMVGGDLDDAYVFEPATGDKYSFLHESVKVILL